MTKLADVVEATAIRPFQMVSVPDAELTELRRRINATRWPERETVTFSIVGHAGDRAQAGPDALHQTLRKERQPLLRAR